MTEVRELAAQAERAGPFHAVVHNAGYRGRGAHRLVTGDGLELTFQVNVLAPYLLTALLPRPERLVYLSSGVHLNGTPDLTDLRWEQRPYDDGQAYFDSKLYLVALAFAVARRWPQVRSNAVDPGWVRTRMGGAGAPTNLADGAATTVRLAAATDPEAAAMTGRYLSGRGGVHPAAEGLGDAVLEACARLSGVPLPA